MSLKQRRTLVTVAENGGVAVAARASNIFQPAVTRTLRELERALDHRPAREALPSPELRAMNAHLFAVAGTSTPSATRRFWNP